ncbi:hypothetical protein [Bradyrhizobium manausense]|uniref:hypothetical protein n=1 Tax=Bradyrhizobium manausense TaxID=989370 RepID=UPI0012EE4022|nr:hypothetical protein [Bradyrhizobium manausense]
MVDKYLRDDTGALLIVPFSSKLGHCRAAEIAWCQWVVLLAKCWPDKQERGERQDRGQLQHPRFPGLTFEMLATTVPTS